MKGKPLIEIEEWCLVDAKNVLQEHKRLLEAEIFVSFMWHGCDALVFEYPDEEDEIESESRYLDAEDSQVGKCWYCMTKAPQDLHTAWIIHNMDIISQLPDPYKNSWEPKYKAERIKNIKQSKKYAKKVGWYEER